VRQGRPQFRKGRAAETGYRLLEEPDIAALCAGLAAAQTVVFAGSRHPALRARYRETVAARRPALTIFSPSYSVYDYTTDELEDFLRGADLTFVNEHEAQFLCTELGDREFGRVMARSQRGGVVTRGAAGASLYPRDAAEVAFPSTSGVLGDVVGAGEAFLCGFIEGFLQTGDFLTAGRLGIAVAAQTARDGRICAPIDAAQAKAEAILP
jgi:sugar/nucleoside kinase (ribokinase family)